MYPKGFPSPTINNRREEEEGGEESSEEVDIDADMAAMAGGGSG